MPFFKSNKIKSASAAPTPEQTPRSSMQTLRTKQTTTMTHAQAFEMMQNMPNSYPRSTKKHDKLQCLSQD
ncbi:hypothetical protein BGZ49_001547 [Haplosporangium sp. Z 27]|nr:hypothetical protein BGZ49_001547 [Haplosporangium sp. Z 27]